MVLEKTILFTSKGIMLYIMAMHLLSHTFYYYNLSGKVPKTETFFNANILILFHFRNL
jgi:hypothetical protein